MINGKRVAVVLPAYESGRRLTTTFENYYTAETIER